MTQINLLNFNVMKRKYVSIHQRRKIVIFLFVTDKYSSLNNVKLTNRIVSFLKEWENMHHNNLLTISDYNLSSLHLRFGTSHPDCSPLTCPESCSKCPTWSFWPSGKIKGSSMKLINSKILLGTSLDKNYFYP